ncbi:MAG: hypothetical protein ACOC7R_01915 [Planctomycetota bacterium]
MDPRQTLRFDPAESLFSPKTIKAAKDDWPGVFRRQILHLMPVEQMADHFHPAAALRQAVAEQLLRLVERFADVPAVAGRTPYKAMRQVLDEPCEVTAETVRLKTTTGGDVMRNPSDPDATSDGHKGPGDQAQIAEISPSTNRPRPSNAARPGMNPVRASTIRPRARR